jgi:hypothetical protein
MLAPQMAQVVVMRCCCAHTSASAGVENGSLRTAMVPDVFGMSARQLERRDRQVGRLGKVAVSVATVADAAGLTWLAG